MDLYLIRDAYFINMHMNIILNHRATYQADFLNAIFV